MSDRVKVLFIAGADRSGSTLLDLLLGSVDGFAAVGEVGNIWQRGLLDGRLCGCGVPLPECEVWADALSETFGHVPEPGEIRDVLAIRTHLVRVRRTHDILHRQRPEIGRYLGVLSRLYAAIARRTGSDVVVDSSKDPSDAAALLLTPGIDTFVVHLVRDPRAVAFSVRRRPKVQPDTAQPSRMARRSVVKATVDWLAWNLGTELVTRAIPDRSAFLRYEDLAAAPREATARLAALVGHPSSTSPFFGPMDAIVEPSHTVSGNPTRFTDGPVHVSLDDDWIPRQPRQDRIVSTALAAPLLVRYGYPLINVDADRTRSRRG